MISTTQQPLIDIVLEWARSMRAVHEATVEYARLGDLIGDRLSFLDDHPDYRRSSVELERDRALLAEQKAMGARVLEAEAHEGKLLAALRLAADAELADVPGTGE